MQYYKFLIIKSLSFYRIYLCHVVIPSICDDATFFTSPTTTWSTSTISIGSARSMGSSCSSVLNDIWWDKYTNLNTFYYIHNIESHISIYKSENKVPELKWLDRRWPAATPVPKTAAPAATNPIFWRGSVEGVMPKNLSCAWTSWLIQKFIVIITERNKIQDIFLLNK